MEYISQLLYKHRQGSLTPEEEQDLRRWAESDLANRQLLQRVDNDSDTVAGLQEWYAIPHKKLSDNKELDALVEAGDTQRRILPRSKWLPYAAAIILLLIVSVLLVFRHQTNQQERQQQVAMSEILPGRHQAAVVFSDGKSLELRSDQNEIRFGHQEILYGDGSLLVPNESRSLTVRTPRGGHYQMVLPDGTRVWLNAASELTYPAHFGKEARTVTLSGEAYFEVAKSDDGTCFTVQTPQMDIKVLGTQFNVNAYPDQPATKATLINGSVEVATSDGHSMMMKPGQQVSRTRDGLSIMEVDVRLSVAWKEGYFMFENTLLEDIARQLSRWYVISVNYDAMPELHFTGGLPRNVPLDQVIKMLENSGKIQFVLEDNQLSIR